MEPNRQAHIAITEEFYSKPRTKEQTIALLMDRGYRELQGALEIAKQVPRFVDGERDLFHMITKQVGDEARHYQLLASILEDLLGRPIAP